VGKVFISVNWYAVNQVANKASDVLFKRNFISRESRPSSHDLSHVLPGFNQYQRRRPGDTL